MPLDPLEQARRDRLIRGGLIMISPLAQGIDALSRARKLYGDFAEEQKAKESLVGDYLTALEPVGQIGSDLIESGQMVGNAIQAGSGAAAGLIAKGLDPYEMVFGDQTQPSAYERSYEDRLRESGGVPEEFDILDIGRTLETAPGPGDVIAEAAAPGRPETVAGRIGKTIGAQAGNLVLDPANLATGGIGAAGDLAASGRYADAAAQLIGSPIAAAVYAPDIIGTVQSGYETALDPSRSVSERLEAGAQATIAAGLGGLAAHGATRELSGGSFADRIAMKREAKAQGMDDVPAPAPAQPVQAAPVEAPAIREPQPLPEFAPLDGPVTPLRAPEPADRAETAPPEPDIVTPVTEIPVAPERIEADIPQQDPLIPPDEVAAPEPTVTNLPTRDESAPAESAATEPFKFPLRELPEEVRPQAEALGTALAERFSEEGRFDQAALDEALATDPGIAPYADQIKRHSILEASALIQGKGFLDDIRDYHGDDGADGIQVVPAALHEGTAADKASSYDVIQRKDGRIVGAASVRNGVLSMVAGGRKMGSPESIRPVYEAIDAAGAKRNDLLTILGAKSRETRASRLAESSRPDAGIPIETGGRVAEPIPRPGDAVRIQPEAERAPTHPLDRDEPLPIRQLIDTARQRLAQHERTRAPESAVANDLGSAVYHVVASGLKKTLPQVRGFIKRHLGTWLRKVGFAGEKLNKFIAKAYSAAQTRWAEHQDFMRAQFGEPERGSLSNKKQQPTGLTREEIDRQLRTNPELAGMARAQLESVAASAGKPMTRLNTNDIRAAFPGDDPNSRYSRALLNRVAAAERAKAPIEEGPEGGLESDLQRSLANPTRGPRTLTNPRAVSGKVREGKPTPTRIAVKKRPPGYQAPTPEGSKAAAESVENSSLPTETRAKVKAHLPAAEKVVGHGEIVRLEDIDPGVRGALRLKTNADLKRMLGGRKVTQAEVAAFKLAAQEHAAKTRDHYETWLAAKTDKEKASAMEAYLDSQLAQAENLRSFAGDSAEAARIAKARKAVGETDAVRKLFSSLRPETSGRITDHQAAQLATLMDEVMHGRRPASELGEAIHAAVKPTGFDKVLEWWKAGLLSGPPTHIANFVGNTTNLLLDVAKTGVAGVIDKQLSRGILGVPRKAQERFVSDLGASLHGIVGALPQALKQFGSDMSAMAKLGPEKFDVNAGLFEGQIGAIGGKLGRAVRIPFRALSASDGFFRALLTSSEQFKEANRAAERLILNDRMDRGNKSEYMSQWLERMRDPANADTFKPVSDRIQHEVRKGLFQQEADELTRLVQRGIHSKWGKPLQFFVPFVKTPVNILKTTMRYTPPGALAAIKRAQSDDPVVRAEGIDDIAKGLVGTVIGGALVAAASQGLITGSGPSDNKDRSLKMQTGWRPHALAIGTGEDKTYVPLDRLEPLGTLFGLAGDIAELKDEKKAGDAFSKIVQMVKDNVLNKSYLEGLSNVFELMSDPDRYGEQFLRSMAGSFVPAISGRLAQGLDPVIRDTKGEGDSMPAKILDSMRKSMQSRIPGLSQQLEPRKTPSGAAMERGGNFVTRAIVPSAISESKSTPEAKIANELLKVGYSPDPPRRQVTIGGRKIDLTNEEYKSLEDAKERASAEVLRVMHTPQYQQLVDSVEEGGQNSKEAVVRRIYQGYQERARHELYRTSRIAKERRRQDAQRMPNIRIQFRDR